MKQVSLVFLLFVFSWSSIAAVDEEWGDDWGEDSAQDMPITMFSEFGWGQFIKDYIVKSPKSLFEVRHGMELNSNIKQFAIKVNGEVIYDDLDSGLKWQTRELYLSGALSKSIDIKFGRQILTWGTGDYLFLNDLFPKNWQSFFSGRDDVYLKSSSDSVKVSTYYNQFAFELAYTPKFEPDTIIRGNRFSFFDPSSSKVIAPNAIVTNEPNSESWAARVSTSVGSTELALYANKGFWSTPEGVNDFGEMYYPKLNAYGASIRTPFANGLLNVEFANYVSKEDAKGIDPRIANDQIRWLVGYEQELMKNLTLSVQGYLEKTQKYDQLINQSFWPQYEQHENRTITTIRITYRQMNQQLIWSLFGFYSPSDDDTNIRPSVSYRMNDHWQLAAGANIFNGKHKNSFFAQHKANSNAWVRVKYNY